MSSNGTKFSTYWIGLIFGKNRVIRVTSSKARERKLMKAGLLSRLLKEKITVWNTGSITTEKMKIWDASLWIWSLFFVLLGVQTLVRLYLSTRYFMMKNSSPGGGEDIR